MQNWDFICSNVECYLQGWRIHISGEPNVLCPDISGLFLFLESLIKIRGLTLVFLMFMNTLLFKEITLRT